MPISRREIGGAAAQYAEEVRGPQLSDPRTDLPAQGLGAGARRWGFAFTAAAARRCGASFRSSGGGREARGIHIPRERTEARLWRNPRKSTTPSCARSTRICGATRLRDFVKKYGNWLIAAVILFLVAPRRDHLVAAAPGKDQAAAQVEQLAQTYRDIGDGNIAKAPAAARRTVEQLGARPSAPPPCSPAPRWRSQKNDQQGGDCQISAKSPAKAAFRQPYRDAALIRQTALEFDQLQAGGGDRPAEAAGEPGEPVVRKRRRDDRAGAHQAGQEAGGGAAVRRDRQGQERSPIPSARRAVQIAGTLGVDASAALDEWPSRIAQ